MAQTVSIFCDNGKQFVFLGEMLLEIEFRDSDSWDYLKVTFFKRSFPETTADSESLVVARIISSTLHAYMPTCHASNNHEDGRKSVSENKISAVMGAGIWEAFNAFESKYPRASLIDPTELNLMQ